MPKLSGLLSQLTKPRTLPLTQKIFFVQQLGVMLKSGISLSVALKTLSLQTNSKSFKLIMEDAQASVEKGNLLSKSLEPYQKLFGELFLNMIQAGETSGKLEEVLDQLFTQMKKDHEIVSKVKGAMIYPAIVVTMMLVIGSIMLVYVIPTISTVFEEMDVELPITTRILIGSSNFAIKYGVYILIILVIAIVSFILSLKNPKIKLTYHQLMLRLPIIGTIIKKINLARFSRTLSSLLRTDIPIVQSCEITSKVLGNAVYRQALISARDKIKKGISIQESLSAYQNIFPPVVLQMIMVGEQTGSLDNILEESALFYEEEVSQTMSNLPSIIEPLLIVVLGIGVGAMAVAVIMPIYSLSEQL